MTGTDLRGSFARVVLLGLYGTRLDARLGLGPDRVYTDGDPDDEQLLDAASRWWASLHTSRWASLVLHADPGDAG